VLVLVLLVLLPESGEVGAAARRHLQAPPHLTCHKLQPQPAELQLLGEGADLGVRGHQQHLLQHARHGRLLHQRLDLRERVHAGDAGMDGVPTAPGHLHTQSVASTVQAGNNSAVAHRDAEAGAAVPGLGHRYAQRVVADPARVRVRVRVRVRA